jgi:hypothetical protein
MPVTEQQLAAVRALILGDSSDFIRVGGQLTDADMYGYELLLQASLSVAARRRFSSGYSDGDLIRYVARIRAGTGNRAEDMDLDPLATETTLRHALAQPVPYIHDPVTRLRSSMALLTVLVSDLGLEESGVDHLLGAARPLAERWHSERLQAPDR